VMKRDKASGSWDKIIARNRAKRPDNEYNTSGIMTTPEGFKFTYDKWVKNPLANSELIKASTYDNPFLPDGYIETLKESYDEKLLAAYLNGEFVNLSSGQVYHAFDNDRHMSDGEIPIDPTLPICLCVDFNVNPGAWEIIQFRTRYDIRVLMEITAPNTNTHDMCIRTKEALPDFCRYMDLVVYGDAAGEHRSTQSTETDYTIMHREFSNFFRSVSYRVPKSNPPVKTRTLCVNNVLNKNSVKLSKSVVGLQEDFIQVVYTEKGEIDKSNMSRTHYSDAFGYFVTVEAPIIHKREYMEVIQR
ncbi:MAG: terminase large subunit domain-containing protein, partial [Candidatus Hodarchaeales archaeon]